MTAKSRADRRRAARRASRQPAARLALDPAGRRRVIVGVAVVAMVLSQAGSGGAGASRRTVAGADRGRRAGDHRLALPKFTPDPGRPGLGMRRRPWSGQDYAGHTVTIAPTGKPMLVIFAAHWCPHCQREVPLIQQWINAGKAPPDVELRSVSTGIDPTAPNYPPEAWFESVGWTVPLIVDPTNSVATAYGLSSYPYFVLLDGKGAVVSRFAARSRSATSRRSWPPCRAAEGDDPAEHIRQITTYGTLRRSCARRPCISPMTKPKGSGVSPCGRGDRRPS